MAGNTVVVSVVADTKKFTDGFKDAGSKAELLTKGLAVGAAAAGAALVAVGAFAAAAVRAAGESQVVASQTDAVIKSTGEAAGRSAKQVADLATKLSRISGVDDEVIQSAENMLLTFTGIKGTQFDQATAAALDMAQALGTDATSSAQQLGKALNDPVAGVSKLQRVGVTFTDEQKKQIENYAAMGDLASAQGVILAEVNKEFGGSAAAFGSTWEGAIANFKNSWGNILETIGGALLPALTAGLTAVTYKLNAIQDNPAFAAIVASISGFITSLVSGSSPIAGFGAQIASLAGFFSPFGIVLKVIQPLLPQLMDGLSQVASVIGGTLGSVLPVITGLLEQVVGVLSGALAAVLPMLIPLIVQIAQTFGTVLAAVLPVVTVLLQAVVDVVAALLPVLMPIIAVVLSVVQAFLPLVAVIGQLIGAILPPLISILMAVLEPILALVAPLVSLLAPAIQFVVGVLSVMIQIVVEVITWLVKLATGSEEAQAQVVAAWGNVMDFFGGIGAAISGFFSGAAQWLVEAGQNIIQGLIDGITGAVDGLFGFINDVGQNIADTFANVLGIHSPSRVFASFGKNVVQGLQQGLSAPNALASIMGSLSTQVQGSFAIPTLRVIEGSSVSGNLGPTSVTNVTVTQINPVTRDPLKQLREESERVAAGIWA